MLNPFPMLLDYQFFGPTLLRLVVGFYVLWLGYIKFARREPELCEFFESIKLKPASYYLTALAAGEILASLCLIIGFLTQIAAAIIAVISLVSLIISLRYPTAKLRMPIEYVFVLTVSLALLVMGAGRLAFDWPL